jgi:hypothetical protein
LIYQKQTNMQIILNTEDVAKILHTCFCDGGLQLIGQCDITLEYDKDDYKAARTALTDPCLEDVYIQMLKEKRRFFFVDNGNDGEEIDITLEKAIENLQKALDNEQDTETKEDVILLLSEDGDYDAIPCYRLLQIAVFGEVIYG